MVNLALTGFRLCPGSASGTDNPSKVTLEVLTTLSTGLTFAIIRDLLFFASSVGKVFPNKYTCSKTPFPVLEREPILSAVHS